MKFLYKSLAAERQIKIPLFKANEGKLLPGANRIIPDCIQGHVSLFREFVGQIKVK